MRKIEAKSRYKKKQYYFHRKLLLRLFLVGIIVSLFFGILITRRTESLLGKIVVSEALLGIKIFNYQAQSALESGDPKAIQTEVNDFYVGSLGSKVGHFVYSRIYNKDGEILAVKSSKTYLHLAQIKKKMTNSQKWFPKPKSEKYKYFSMDGIDFIEVALPLINKKGKVIAYADGAFLITEATIKTIRNRGIEMGLWIAAIVLITTLLLYPVIIRLMRRLENLALNLSDSHMEMLKVLGSAIAKRDSDTDSHNYRVSIMAVRLAEALQLEGKVIRTIIKGALLHDVGKIGIPDNILLKPDKLTTNEFDIMKSHVQKGLDIVKRYQWLQDAAEVIGNHHEWMDGEGYPHHTKENPVSSRVFAIIDVFDALTSSRPYKKAFSLEKTLDIIKENRGTQFDTEFLDKFISIAPLLHKTVAGREDDGLKEELQKIIDTYFTGDIRELLL